MYKRVLVVLLILPLCSCAVFQKKASVKTLPKTKSVWGEFDYGWKNTYSTYRQRPQNLKHPTRTYKPQVKDVVKHYRYVDGGTYNITCPVGRITDIMLQPGENLISVSAGNTTYFNIHTDVISGGTDSSPRRHVFVKPIRSGLSTDMIITTDRRVYRLQLKSSKTAAHVRAISWVYENQFSSNYHYNQYRNSIRDTIYKKRLHLDYSMSGSADWEPVSAFHDGHKTYIQFASDSVLPALYNLSPKGKTELINWRYVDSLLIVDRVLKGAVLVYGKEQITLYNPKYFRKRLGRWVSK